MNHLQLKAHSYLTYMLFAVVVSAISSFGQTPPLLLPNQEGAPYFSQLVFSHDGSKLIGVGRPSTLWNTSNGEVITSYDVEDRLVFEHHGQTYSGSIYTATFSNDGNIVAFGASPVTILFWDTRTGETVQRITLPYDDYLIPAQSPFTSLAYSPDGSYLFTGYQVFDNVTGELMQYIQHGNFTNTVAYLPDGVRAIATTNSRVLLFSLEAGVKLYEFSGAAGTLSLEGKHVYTITQATQRDKVRLTEWDVDSGEVSKYFSDFTNVSGPNYAISGKSRLILHKGNESVQEPTRIVSPETGNSLRSLRVNDRDVYEYVTAAFSPQGDKLAVVINRNEVLLYDISDLETGIPDAPLHRQ